MKKVAVVIPARSRMDIATICSGESANVLSAEARVASSGKTSSAADIVAWTLAQRNWSIQKSFCGTIRCYSGLTNSSLPGTAQLALFPERGRSVSVELEARSVNADMRLVLLYFSEASVSFCSPMRRAPGPAVQSDSP